MEKLIIRRSEWATGAESTALLDSKWKMCCLGFWAIQKGYTRDQIFKIKTPLDLMRQHGILPDTSNFVRPTSDGNMKNSQACYEAMRINDRLYLSNSERELKLTELFKHKFSIELEFVD